MSTPIHTFTNFMGQSARRLSPRSSSNHLREQAQAQVADHFEHSNNTIQLRLAELRSREEHLTDCEVAELADLNEAQQLQQMIEANCLLDEDVREATRLAHLRQAFTSPGYKSAQHSGDQFERTSRPETPKPEHNPPDPQARLADLRSREADLDAVEQVELYELSEAKRLQVAFEQNNLANDEIQEAFRLADLRKAFETPKATPQTRPSRQYALSGSALSHNTEYINRPGQSAKKAKPKSGETSDPQRNASERSTGTTSQTPLSGARMQEHELFGRNLREVTIQQGNNNSCYLLSALDAILHHPQGQRILDLIPVNRVPNGYQVRFPAHPEPIFVPETDLRASGIPRSNQIGIPIIWNAYFRLPDALNPQMLDTTHNALRRMFGNRVAEARDTINDTLDESNQLRHILTETADIWTATPLHRSASGRISAGNHYFSVRPNQDLSMHLADPLNTSQATSHVINQNSFSREYFPELTRIHLG